MEEKVSIEQATADGFLHIFNKQNGRTFKIVRLGDSPDVECKDDQGKALNLEIRSEEHTSELQSRRDLVCRLLLEKKKKKKITEKSTKSKNLITTNIKE